MCYFSNRFGLASTAWCASTQIVYGHAKWTLSKIAFYFLRDLMTRTPWNASYIIMERVNLVGNFGDGLASFCFPNETHPFDASIACNVNELTWNFKLPRTYSTGTRSRLHLMLSIDLRTMFDCSISWRVNNQWIKKTIEIEVCLVFWVHRIDFSLKFKVWIDENGDWIIFGLRKQLQINSSSAWWVSSMEQLLDCMTSWIIPSSNNSNTQWLFKRTEINGAWTVLESMKT